MKLIVGLGNIGFHYSGTRHNMGFTSVEGFAAANSIVWQTKDKFKASTAEATLHGTKVILAKPTTLYNASGDAVRALKDFYKLDNADILIVHDELALPFGTIRTSTVGGDAGNNGIKSVIAAIGKNVARIRIGIANQYTASKDVADFVLSQFNPEERSHLAGIQTEAQRLIAAFIQQGRLPHSSWRA